VIIGAFMFYSDSIEEKLRLGDVLEGYLSTTPSIENPLGEAPDTSYRIDVNLPEFCVIMDNCCHIGAGTILLSPLVQIEHHFWDTPSLADNILRINSLAMPQELMHPEQWNKLSADSKREFLNVVPSYGHKRYFIYDKKASFTSYDVHREAQYREKIDEDTQLPIYERIAEEKVFSTKQYTIDFKKLFRVNCRKISKSAMDKKVLDSKIAQLTVETRNQLREKMAMFFGEVPLEDRR